MMQNFIPKPYKKEQITVRVDIETLERIESLLPHYDLNRNQFINRCIEFALAHMEENGEEPRRGALPACWMPCIRQN